MVDGIAGKATQISIHAPLAGCDYTEALGETVTYEFQSTHPLRGATAYPPRPWPNGRFQSTHPLRGATRRLRRNARHRAHFNPRTPCGVRPRSIFPRRYRPDFNPRTPCGVRRHGGSLRQRHGDFNPRTPCGVRLGKVATVTIGTISIHAPLAGCDNKNPSIQERYHRFQSTHTLRGATALGRVADPDQIDFNPRTPCGVRRVTLPVDDILPYISIHAPLAGCDLNLIVQPSKIVISIHAPLAGCDQSCFSGGTTSEFQSTHPLRGATYSVFSVGADDLNFNPRTPCGVRPNPAAPAQEAAADFNPRTPCGVRPAC